MFFSQKNDLKQLEKDLEDSIIENNTLKQTIRNIESKITEKKENKSHPFLGTLLHTNSNKVKLYVSQCRALFPNIRPWDFNRPIDKDHVIQLKDIISKKGYLEGYFDILECGNKLSIVNGQHRFQAIMDIMKQNPDFTFEIYCNVHPVPDFNGQQATDIFLSTNNIKNVTLKDNPDQKLMNVCLRLQTTFPNGLCSNKSGKAYLHRLDIKELYNVLQMNENLTDSSAGEQYIYHKIIQLNNKLSLQPFESYFKRRTEKNEKIYKGACESKFFIGLKKGGSLGMLFLNL